MGILRAVLDGDEAGVEAALRDGASVDTTDLGGWTALMLAILCLHMRIVKLLLARGATVQTAGNEGATPVFVAAQKGQAEVVRVLAELGANTETPTNEGATPASIAAQNGHLNVVRLHVGAPDSHTGWQSVASAQSEPV